jgi:hypothetical protein
MRYNKIMTSGELPSKNDRSARSGSSRRREFLGLTMGGGALFAATRVLGSELRSPENQAEPHTNDLPRDPSSGGSVTTADLLVDKLAEWTCR